METRVRTATTDSLQIFYEETGPEGGVPVVLLHGFPYDVRQYDGVRDGLASSGVRILVPYLRGFGPTSYRAPQIFRSGQQAALGKDVVDLLDALGVHNAILVGYDWGGRAACVAAALWPERVRALISASGYAPQNIARTASEPAPPEKAWRLWYQSYLNTDIGRLGLREHCDDFCRLLWKQWSPAWRFTQEEYVRTAASFRNPDFVDTVVQSYRHRYANASGDPALEALETRLAAQPSIAAPTVVLHGGDDQVEPPATTDFHDQHFTGFYERRILTGVGHCLPAEAPAEVVSAIQLLLRMSGALQN